MIPSITTRLLPIIIFFFLIELIYSAKENKHLYSKRDTVNNLVIGIVTFITQALSKLFVFYFFQLAFRYRLLDFSNSVFTWALAFLGCELTSYWFHRASHEISWFWASHVVHHSSEEYNLSVAVRLPWFTQFTGKFLFWIWMPLLGFEPAIILIIMQVEDFYMGLLHTKTIYKFPKFFEFIFNTPSHHRVHHSKDLAYMDKNYGSMMIIFDRAFGTFAEETMTPSYGLSNKTESSNIGTIMFGEWADLFKKASHSGSFKNAIRYFLMAPGWSHDGSSKTIAEIRKTQKTNKIGGYEKERMMVEFAYTKKCLNDKTLALVILLSLLVPFAGAGQNDWVLQKNQNGIEVYTKVDQHSKYNELSVHCILEGSISRLVDLIFDMDSHKDWVYRLANCYLLKRISPTDIIFYNETECPWPLHNRDLVAHLTLLRDSKNKSVIIDAQSMDNYVPAKANVVRMKFSHVQWKLFAISAKLIRIEYTIQVDPGGSIPAWVLNLFSTKGPFETFSKLKEMLRQSNNRESGTYAALDQP